MAEGRNEVRKKGQAANWAWMEHPDGRVCLCVVLAWDSGIDDELEFTKWNGGKEGWKQAS